MANVKGFFKELSRTVAFVERGGDPRVLQTSLNLRLTGNPGPLCLEKRLIHIPLAMKLSPKAQ